MNLNTNGEATYGHAEKAGAWDIQLGPLDSVSPRALNQTVDDMTEAFVEAFAEIGTFEYAEGTVTEVGEDGRILSVWAEVPLAAQEGRFRPVPGANGRGMSESSVLSSIMLIYTVTVIQADAEQRSRPVSDGLYFHYDSGLPSLVDAPAKPDTAFARVDVEIDPWLDAPLHHGRFLDNRATAALNRPRLENALRRWEAASGKPIDHWISVPYWSFVDRYGFRPGGQPDPA